MKQFNDEKEKIAEIELRMKRNFIHPKFFSLHELAIDLITDFLSARKIDVIHHLMGRYEINKWNTERAWKIFKNFKNDLKEIENSKKNPFIPKTILLKNRSKNL
jgi:hypothetical protein